MKLTDAKKQFTGWLLTRGLSENTADAYVLALAKYAAFLKKHPEAVDLSHSKRVEMYLTVRVQDDDISPSTQGVELNALVQFHLLRHACLTHMAADMIQKGFTETMITAELKKISGHVNDETLWGYIHLAAPKNSFVVSPIEGLVQSTYADSVA